MPRKRDQPSLSGPGGMLVKSWRLSETCIDEGGFRIKQQKAGREVWCPIDDKLAAEMAPWERAPGPYLRPQIGKAFDRMALDRDFARARASLPEFAGMTLLQIQDQVGMSVAMIERYCRFADKKMSGRASVVALAERRKNAEL